MARKVDSYLVDDFDGSRPAQTYSFSCDGVEYEIDLGEHSLKQFRDDLAPYIKKARRVNRRTVRGSVQRHEKLQAARVWLREQGHEVGSKGRIPKSLLEKFEKAQSGG